MVTLSRKPGWRERLPEGLADLSERLLLAAGEPLYNRLTLHWGKRPWAVQLSDLGERLQPGTFEGLGERKLFMNAQVLAALESGASQVLVIGAGFDTLCLRLAPLYPAVRFVEIDHPATAAAKRRGVERIGRPQNMSMIAADLGQVYLEAVLEDCDDWDGSAPSVVVAEGLLYYLPRAAVRDLFAALARCTAPGSRVCFSHLTELRRHGLARTALWLSREPWLSASTAKRLEDYLGPGWRILETAAGAYRDLEGFALAEQRAP